MKKGHHALGIFRFLSLTMLFLLPFKGSAQQNEKAAAVSKPIKTKAEKTPTSSADASRAKDGQAFDRIITHENELQILQLMLLSAFEPDSKKIGSLDDAENLFKNTQKSVGDSQDEAPNLAISSNIAKDAAALIGYYLANPTFKDGKSRLKTAAQWLQKFATAYGEASKKPGQKQKSLYWAALGKFIVTEGSDGISDLIPLRDQLASEKELAANIDLLVGYSLSISPSTSRQGFSYMNQAANQISNYGRIAEKLTEAYVDQGLDADGNPTGTVKSGADTKLTYAAQVAKGMPPGIQHLIMNTVIYIWTHASANQNQKAPSYLIEGFSGLIPVEALREQEALSQLKTKNYKAAAVLYRTIANSFSNSELSPKIDNRIWDIELLSFQKTGQLTELESAFMSFRERYKDHKTSGGNEVASLANFAESYRKILDQVLTASLAPNASATQKSSSILAVLRYLKIESDRQLSYPLKAKLALLYRAMNNYKEAVDTYLDIVKEQPTKNYLLAIEAQSKLANWPTQASFDKPAPGEEAERIKLLGIYDILSQLKNSEDWFMLAHIGLLNRAIGKNKKAEEIWLKALKTNLNTRLSLEAGGLLLSEFNAEKRWEDLIDLTHIFMIKKMTPIVKSKQQNIMPWLSDGLYNAGLIDLQAQNFPRSVKHFEEFIQLFPNDSRIAAASYSLAFAYKGLGKMGSALNISKTIIEKYNRFPLRPKVMLQAAEWAAADKNTWEYAFYFYTKYLSEFKNEKNIPEIRNTLAELYLKRKLYGWAARLYKEQSLANNVSREAQLAAALKYLDIEEQYGEPKDAYAGAIRITQLVGAKDQAIQHAYAFMGRYVTNNKDLKGMGEMEPKLLPFLKTSKEIQETIGFMRFRRAELLTKPIIYTENNLLIKDPEAIVKKYFDVFESEKQLYLKVCQIGISTYCAPAMFRLTVVAKQGLEALEKISIAETLGSNRTNSFKVYKQLHISKVQKAQKEFIDQALKLAKAGTSTPIWKDEIVKTLEYEDRTETAH